MQVQNEHKTSNFIEKRLLIRFQNIEQNIFTLKKAQRFEQWLTHNSGEGWHGVTSWACLTLPTNLFRMYKHFHLDPFAWNLNFDVAISSLIYHHKRSFYDSILSYIWIYSYGKSPVLFELKYKGNRGYEIILYRTFNENCCVEINVEIFK